MRYAQYICKLCRKELIEKDEYCPDCGKEGKKIIIAKSSSDEIEFVKKNSPMMVKSTNALKNWINFIKQQ